MTGLYRPAREDLRWRRRQRTRSRAAYAGLDFNAAGYEFTQRTGVNTEDVSVFASASLNITVYPAAYPLVEAFRYTESTSAGGFLTRKTHASLVAGSYYYCAFIDAATGLLFGMRRVQASA